ncbi:MAG TPA: sugar nucleotide-binding protein, partial [Candidatus Eisenbergiella pullistercoris]|nr:sugar nucleotide-binding protein [Candidatus Eisenbergiella pullistercoris]
MRILLTGAGGFLGSRLLAYYGKKYEVWAPSHGELDFTKEEETEKAVRAFWPEVLLHCGAISDVGACEREPELSLRVNVEGTRNLARACREAGARMVMCSSDQVYFRGQEEGEGREAFLSPHREEEACRPIPVYGKHKLLAEKACFAEQPDSVILRLTWMYGELTEEERQKGKGNLAVTLRKMLREKRSQSFLTTDHRGVTDVNEVVRQMEAAWRLPAGIYNFGSPSSGSMYETARSVLAAF